MGSGPFEDNLKLLQCQATALLQALDPGQLEVRIIKVVLAVDEVAVGTMWAEALLVSTDFIPEVLWDKLVLSFVDLCFTVGILASLFVLADFSFLNGFTELSGTPAGSLLAELLLLQMSWLRHGNRALKLIMAVFLRSYKRLRVYFEDGPGLSKSWTTVIRGLRSPLPLVRLFGSLFVPSASILIVLKLGLSIIASRSGSPFSLDLGLHKLVIVVA